eukprot:Skav235687  [mRNA]  locus=scaffold280:104397:105899:+ [translate_table: standard]
MTPDPGYYQLWHCVFDFRRICQKTPDLLQQWRIYMARYSGKKTAGPFYKLLTLFTQLGWSILDVPLFRDHDGCVHDLLRLPNSALDALLRDAWLQWVAQQVSHRKTMMDLNSLDGDLTFFERSTMTPALLGRVMALQTGAFIPASQKSKFDNQKSKWCALCHVEDDQRRWFHCPRFVSMHARFPGLQGWIDDMPNSVVYRLLPPQNPHVVHLKKYFLELQDCTGSFCSVPSQGMQHLFSDGSCFQRPVAFASQAAWSVVNATAGQLTGHGALSGIVQTSARAGLTAVVAALRWILRYEATATLWCDSLFVVKGVKNMQVGSWTFVASRVENHDLWIQILSLLEQVPDNCFQMDWIPSHLAFELCEAGFEEWISCWNNVADACDVSTNEHRSAFFQNCRDQALEHHSLWCQRMAIIRDFYVAVAEQTSDDIVIDLTSSMPSDALAAQVDGLCLSDALPVNWRQQLEFVFSQSTDHFQYAVEMMELLFCFEEQGCEFRVYSM